MDKQQIIDTTKPILERYGATGASLFGSYAVQDHNVQSDVDIIVSMPRGTGMFRFSELRLDLENALGKPVDLISEHGAKPSFMKSIRNDLERII